MTPQQWSYVAGALGLAVIVGIRIFRMRKARPLKLERLWIVPVLYSAFAVAVFWYLPPHGWQWAIATAALVAGGGLGWLRGSTMRIAVDPVTHDLNQRQSPAAILLIVVLIAARFLLREQLAGDPTHPAAGVIDAFVAFAVGLLSMQRLEMFLRARRLLDEARGVRSRSA